MHCPPSNMLSLMQAFADGVRQHNEHRETSIGQYHDFIWGNVHSVVNQTFPMFSQQLQENELNNLVTAFVKHSQAIEPEFHHIATEFVRFMQSGHYTVKPELKTLLEYEWVIFNTEINTEGVKAHSDIFSEKTLLTEYRIELNPTVTLIQVPFSINDNEIAFHKGNQELQAYAIYRNMKHQVLSQPLGYNDRYILEIVSNQYSISVDELLAQVIPQLSENYIHEWIKHYYQTGLVILSQH